MSRATRQRALAASFIVTLAALPACSKTTNTTAEDGSSQTDDGDDDPAIYDGPMNPPPPDDLEGEEETEGSGRFKNDSSELPELTEEEHLERRDDGTCWAHSRLRANPPPPVHQVRCPPGAAETD